MCCIIYDENRAQTCHEFENEIIRQIKMCLLCAAGYFFSFLFFALVRSRDGL